MKNIYIIIIILLSTVVMGTTYTETTEKNCNNGVCTIVIYSSIKFIKENNNWIEIEKAKSLKNILNIEIIEDKEFPAKIIDFNYTHVILNIDTDIKNIDKNIPLTLKDKITLDNKKEYYVKFLEKKESEIVIDLTKSNDTIYTFYLKFGFNSTTITIQSSDGTHDCMCGNDDTYYDDLAYQIVGSSGGNSYDSYSYFKDVNIPQGSNILSSKWEYSAYTNEVDTIVSAVIYMENIDNSSSFPESDDGCSSLEARNRTTASYSVASWFNHSVGLYYNLSGFEDVVQEVIGRQEWVSGNGLTLMIIDNGSTVDRRFNTIEQSAKYQRLYITYEEGSECTPNLQNTSWSAWLNISCLMNDTMNQSRNLTEYDVNECGGANVTYFEYAANETCNYCSYNVTNTSFTEWLNISCLMNDTMNQSRNLTEYDSNYSTCYAITELETDLWNGGENITYIEYQTDGYCEYCIANYTNSTHSYNYIDCWINDSKRWNESWLQYDLNYCNSSTNTTFSIFTYNETCNYCSYNVINTSLYLNTSYDCLENGSSNQSWSKTEYDSNYSTCYAITELETDLWNSGLNNTFTYQIYNDTCTFPQIQYNYTININYSLRIYNKQLPKNICFSFIDGTLCFNSSGIIGG